MKARINLLQALNTQQTEMLSTIYAIENKIEGLEKEISELNNAYELRIMCQATHGSQPGQLLRLRWSDHTAADADAVRQTVRTILQAKLQDSRDRLQRIVEQEESRLAAILKEHGNTELPASDSEVQNQRNQEG